MKRMLLAGAAAISICAGATVQAATVTLAREFTSSALTGTNAPKDYDFTDHRFRLPPLLGLAPVISLSTGTVHSRVTWSAAASGSDHLAGPGRAMFDVAASTSKVEFQSRLGFRLDGSARVLNFVTTFRGIGDILDTSGAGTVLASDTDATAVTIGTPVVFVPPAQTYEAGVTASLVYRAGIEATAFDVLATASHATAGQREASFTIGGGPTHSFGLDLDTPGEWTVEMRMRPVGVVSAEVTARLDGYVGEGIGICGNLRIRGDTVFQTIFGPIDPCIHEAFTQGPIASQLLSARSVVADYGWQPLGATSVFVEAPTVTPTVPLPPGLAMAGTGLALLGWLGRRNRRAAA